MPQMPLAEVLTSSITSLTAETLPSQSGAINNAARPRFGSFVKIQSPENNIDIFAIIFDVVTNPPDSVHKPSALGMTRDQLRLEQPHIFALLKTHMQAAIIGFARGDDFYGHLPPQPAQVHDFVYEASPHEVNMLSSDFEFLRLLSHINSVPTDELIAASIREAASAREGQGDAIDAEQYCIEAGRAISQLYRSDYERMVSIVRKIKPDKQRQY